MQVMTNAAFCFHDDDVNDDNIDDEWDGERWLLSWLLLLSMMIFLLIRIMCVICDACDMFVIMLNIAGDRGGAELQNEYKPNPIVNHLMSWIFNSEFQILGSENFIADFMSINDPSAGPDSVDLILKPNR